MSTSAFAERVYVLCRKIPCGKVTTYGEMARALSMSGYQAVGQALGKNPYAPAVPCHRVVCRDGSLGGFKGTKDSCEKAALLRREGIEICNGKVNLSHHLFCFTREHTQNL